MAKIYKNFEVYFKSCQLEVRREIERRIKDKEIREILDGGKLLRPCMLILSFLACRGKNYEKAIESAIGVELAHTASLIHDDIMDNDRIRRGKPAVHVEKGIGKAILLGHKMINEAFRISLRHGINNAFIFLDTWNETLNGQIKDIEMISQLEKIFRKNKDLGKMIREYFDIIDHKTASLFSAACRAGAIEAEAPQDLIEKLAKYGREVGIAYQLADDLVDIMNGKLEEGIVLAVAKIEKDEKLSDDIRKFIEELDREKLIEIYIAEIKERIEKARDAISSDSRIDKNYKEILYDAPRYIVNEMLKSIGLVIS